MVMPVPMAAHMLQFHPIPFTQQLLQQSSSSSSSHHHFQLFHHSPPPPPPPPPQTQNPAARLIFPPPHHHRRQFPIGGDAREPEPAAAVAEINSPHGGCSGGGGGREFLAGMMNFKLGVDDCGREGGADDDDDEDAAAAERGGIHGWHHEEERPLDIDYIYRNGKRNKHKEPESPPPPPPSLAAAEFYKQSEETPIAAAAADDDEADESGHGRAPTGGSNYKLFSELEAIYKPGSSSGGGGIAEANQTGSGSALTGDENSLIPASNAAFGAAAVLSEMSAGGEAPTEKQPQQINVSSGGGGGGGMRRSKRKRRQKQQQLAAVAAFFETLVRQLMEHQESLHRRFLDAMERRDRERAGRDDAWRRQEAARSARDAAARARDRQLSAAREAAVVAFLEKISGQALHLPPAAADEAATAITTTMAAKIPITAPTDSDVIGAETGGRRWPKAEVEALIGVRWRLEEKFQEPGLKGPLWDEVSAQMAAIGFRRSAKRCKEKWENINKYFRKAKDSGKRRPPHAKTCPYFRQLDELYSKPAATVRNSSELLDAIVVSRESNVDVVDDDDDDDDDTDGAEEGGGGGGGGGGEQEGEGESLSEGEAQGLSNKLDQYKVHHESTNLFF
ncbi:Trihelix transcription factor GT-2 [Ananas comosus]|uniref:Trihelix transcription factor GT-2 n=1 Tax=Ananas comosus TaxID=4615 RepID=A0A199UNM6_ANACO|nr:Trihelix transcription factor GT-2 [Ananas comosus]